MFQRATGYISHSYNTILSETICYSTAYTPEVCQWSMLPKLPTIRHLIKFRYAHSILIRLHLFSYNIHGYLTQIHICSNAGSSSNTRFSQHLTNHLHGQFMSRHLICGKIGCCINKHLVDGIDMHIFWINIAHIHLVNTCTVFDVVSHTGLGHNIV